MAIEKMELVNIIAPIKDYDEIVDKYIIESDVHIEDASEVLGDINGLEGFEKSDDICEGLYKRTLEMCEIMRLDAIYRKESTHYNQDEILAFLSATEKFYSDNRKKYNEITDIMGGNNILIDQLAHMGNATYKLEELFNFKFMRFRFGRMKRNSYDKLITFLGDINALFFVSTEEKDYVYGMYLTPHSCHEEVDNIFASLNFERIRVSDKAFGTPQEAIERVSDENTQLAEQLKSLEEKLNEYRDNNSEKAKAVISSVMRKYAVSKTRLKAARTKKMFIMSDWVPESESGKFSDGLNKDENLIVRTAKPENVSVRPPTRLKHCFFAEPFDMFLSMYGTPSYNEIDPTAFMAITFSIIFGMMYGDVGQGLVLAIGGFILYRLKRVAIAGIMSLAGVFATLFGFMFGSVFGNEGLIRHLWISPMEDAATLLASAVSVGAVFVLLAMIMNIVNSVKKKKYADALFSQNGLAGIVFYGGIIAVVIAKLLLKKNVPSVLTAIITVCPLLIIFLKEALEGIFEGKGISFGESKAEYCMVNGFEMFDVLLSYVTNTISYIRLGAFALVHAGMMMVVYQLAVMGGPPGSFGNTFILIFGNIFVMAMEAFVVSIQVLRLEFYEMMGRYYDGSGKPFESVRINKK